MVDHKRTVLSNNPIWSVERAQGKIIYATLPDLLVFLHSDDPRINLVWPDEGEFLKFGEKTTFRIKDGAELGGLPLVPLICSKEAARTIMQFYDDASEASSRTKLEDMIAKSRRSFSIVFDAAVLHRAS